MNWTTNYTSGQLWHTIYSIYKKHVSVGHSMIFSQFMK